jgi:hypothetical protein
MVGTFTGVAVDDGSAGGYLTANDSVRLAVRWALLEGVVNRALADARNELRARRGYDPTISLRFSEWYLCAIALSDPIQRWLGSNKRSMKDHVYPDDIKAIPVKDLNPERQQPFIDLARQRHRLWAELTELEEQGYRIGTRIELPVHALLGRFRKENPDVRHLTLAQAVAAGLFRIAEAFLTEDLQKARPSGAKVVAGKQTVVEVGAAIEKRTEVAQLLARILAALPSTFAERQGVDTVPANEEGLLALAAWLDEQEAAIRRRHARIEAIGAEIDRLAWALYRAEA